LDAPAHGCSRAPLVTPAPSWPPAGRAPPRWAGSAAGRSGRLPGRPVTGLALWSRGWLAAPAAGLAPRLAGRAERRARPGRARGSQEGVGGSRTAGCSSLQWGKTRKGVAALVLLGGWEGSREGETEGISLETTSSSRPSNR